MNLAILFLFSTFAPQNTKAVFFGPIAQLVIPKQVRDDSSRQLYMYFVYILYSEKIDKYYIGCTENLDKRLEEHNAGLSSFTSKGVPWVRVYFEQLGSLSEARRREIAIKKKKSRKYIEFLVSNRAHSSVG